MREELVNVREAAAAHDALHGDAVLLPELVFQELEQLHFQRVPRCELGVSALGRPRLVAAAERRQEALAEARARADAGDDAVRHLVCVVQRNHLHRALGLVQRQQAVPVRHKIVDEHDLLDALRVLEVVAVDAPLPVREGDGVPRDWAGHGEARGDGPPLAEARRGAEGLEDLLEAAEVLVLVLRAVHQPAGRPLSVLELVVRAHLEEQEPRVGAPAVPGEDRVLLALGEHGPRRRSRPARDSGPAARRESDSAFSA